MWHENGRVRCSYCSKNPFFECSFHEITIEFLLELVQKAACKKLNKQTDRQTDTQTDRIQPISSSAMTMFWTVQTQIPVANASKTCPQNDPRIPVNIPFKEHLRLASVVALSSSGACGAITVHSMNIPGIEKSEHLFIRNYSGYSGYFTRKIPHCLRSL